MANIKLRDNKGVTLIELIVAMSILAIISTPFIASIVTSQNNNTFAEDKLNISNNIQSTIEEIKSKNNFLEDEYNYFKDRSDEYKVYEKYSNDKFEICYRIDKVSEGVIEGRDDEEDKVYSSFADISYDLEFNIQNGKLVIESLEYDLYDEYYQLDITGGSGVYNYDLLFGGIIVKSGLMRNEKTTIDILVNFMDDEPDVLKINSNIEEDLDREVRFNITGDDYDKSRFLINNIGNKMYYIHKNLVEDPVLEYINNLYKIDIVVKENGQIIDRMIAYVKK